jgi:hypothetical protein
MIEFIDGKSQALCEHVRQFLIGKDLVVSSCQVIKWLN